MHIACIISKAFLGFIKLSGASEYKKLMQAKMHSQPRLAGA